MQCCGSEASWLCDWELFSPRGQSASDWRGQASLRSESSDVTWESIYSILDMMVILVTTDNYIISCCKKARSSVLLAGLSGLSTLACCTRGPRFESHCGQKFVFSRKSLRYAALGTSCTLTAVPRSTQPTTLRGTVNEYQPYGWVIIPMVMGECSAYSSLQADWKVKFAA